MKKLFKKGLLALTLIAGMAFAAPQTASADGDTPTYSNGKTFSHYAEVNDDHAHPTLVLTDILLFRDGNNTYILCVWNDGSWTWTPAHP